MLLACLYLSVNLACLIVLVRKGYAQVWPGFMAFQSLTCWQAAVRIAVPDLLSWREGWAPGEMLLLSATAFAAVEVGWKSLKQLGNHRMPTFLALAAGCYCLSTWAVDVAPGDWYAQFLSIRVQIFLALALFSAIACWAAFCFNRRWPRAARMHACLFAGMMAAHVVIVDWSQWHWSNLQYRIVQMLCCAGWMINASFQASDLGALLRAVPRVGVLPLPDPPSLPLARPSAIAQTQPYARGGFGSHAQAGRDSRHAETTRPRWQN